MKNSINYIRQLICGLDYKVPIASGNHVTEINFDNAATTPPLHCVLNDLLSYAPIYSSIHRGTGYKSSASSEIFDRSREKVCEFLNCSSVDNCVIYVKNTTEAVNKLAYRIMAHYDDGIILSSKMEHHSNDLPWREKFQTVYIDIDCYGRLSMEDYKEKLQQYKGRIRLVTVSGASNSTGYTNPIHEMAKLAHEYDTKIMVDGAQLVPHCKIDMKPQDDPEHIDFIVFSAHKMYAPFGIGVLVGEQQFFDCGCSECVGGGTVQLVTPDFVMWDTPPQKEEGGTPNLMGVIALISAINQLSVIGMDTIEQNEQELIDYTMHKLRQIPDVMLYTDLEEATPRVGIIPFNIKDVPHSITAKVLAKEFGIAVRSGCFCCQPYLQKLLHVTHEDIAESLSKNLIPPHGVVRISFGIYNTKAEVDALVNALTIISRNKHIYLEKYPVLPLPLCKCCVSITKK